MVEELSVADKLPKLEDLLKAEGATIEESAYVLEEIDAGFFYTLGLKDKYAALYASTFKILQNFLRAPIIKESFVDHADRQAWEESLKKKYGDGITPILESNKLRGNTLNAAINSLRPLYDDFKDSLQIKWAGYDEFLELAQKVRVGARGGLTQELKDERVQNVRRLSDLAFDFYKAFVAAVKNKQSQV